MSDTTPRAIAAGWYSDPTNPSQLRWWNGTAWSQHTQPRPTAAVPQAQPVAEQPETAPPVIGSPAAQLPATQPPVIQSPITQPPAAQPSTTQTPITQPPAVQQPIPQRAWSELGTPVATTVFTPAAYENESASSRFAPAEAGNAGLASAAESITPTRSNTASSWFVALSPFYFAVAFIIALPALASITSVGYLSAIAAAVVVIPFAIALIFAGVDRGALKKLGHPRPASIGWMFLTPLVYLIVRTVRVRRATGKGSAPLWVWIAAWAVSSAIIGVATVQIIPAVANFQNSSSLAQGIQDGMNSEGGKYRVACPPTAPLTIGSKFTCTAVDGATNTSHTLFLQVIANAQGKPEVHLESVTPPLAG